MEREFAVEPDSTITKSELELLFLAFLENNALPRPQTNHTVAAAGRPYECDFIWRQLRDTSHELAGDLWALLGRAPAAVAS